ncbi:TPA: hypothetical protein J1W43_004399 [Escherichia coli]|nr:hypothetical protein [Escherichia coli]EFJ0227475.1 hypothetical protein [Escherichia coli]HBA6820675.1 hypothetical protein [Escherichia coli]HBA8270672.1 hypothetical protein [Escherichia coli]HBA8733197.1 hypothetical protein [Escherichia coli]
MSGTDTGDVLCGTDVVKAVNVRQKILLTGTCWYELTGLWHLLSAQGHNVYRVPLGYPCAREGWDLIIVALSAEPVAGWGRHLSRIRELRAEMSGEMLVLVPERLEMLKVLRNICPVYSGYMSLSDLERTVRMALNRKALRAGKFRLTSGQRLVLKRLSERGRVCPPLLNPSERSLYWHYARLAENVGVRDFKMLLMTGLDKEVHKMEKVNRTGFPGD